MLVSEALTFFRVGDRLATGVSRQLAGPTRFVAKDRHVHAVVVGPVPPLNVGQWARRIGDARHVYAIIRILEKCVALAPALPPRLVPRKRRRVRAHVGASHVGNRNPGERKALVAPNRPCAYFSVDALAEYAVHAIPPSAHAEWWRGWWAGKRGRGRDLSCCRVKAAPLDVLLVRRGRRWRAQRWRWGVRTANACRFHKALLHSASRGNDTGVGTQHKARK